MNATSETGSLPLSPLAKSAHRPVLKLILKTSRVAIAAPRIERDILATRPSAVGEQAATDGLERGERLGVDAVEVDGAVTKHWSGFLEAETPLMAGLSA
jgi:hypothetical protein